MSEALNGPTTEGGLPPFSWDQFNKTVHQGLPPIYNYTFVTMRPALFTPWACPGVLHHVTFMETVQNRWTWSAAGFWLDKENQIQSGVKDWLCWVFSAFCFLCLWASVWSLLAHCVCSSCIVEKMPPGAAGALRAVVQSRVSVCQCAQCSTCFTYSWSIKSVLTSCFLSLTPWCTEALSWRKYSQCLMSLTVVC